MLFKQDYKNHDTAGIFVGLGILVVGFQHSNTDLLLSGPLIMFSTLMLSPDLDLAPRCQCSNRWEIVYLGWVWTVFGKMFKHRSWFSHCPGLGSAVKVLYMSIPLLLLRLFVPYFTFDQGLVFTLGQSMIRLSPHTLGVCFVSLVISDLVHLLVDIYATALNTGKMFKFH